MKDKAGNSSFILLPSSFQAYMHACAQLAMLGLVLLVALNPALAQPGANSAGEPAPPWMLEPQQNGTGAESLPLMQPAASDSGDMTRTAAIESYHRELAALRAQEAQAQGATEAERLSKQLELQRQQIDVLIRMSRLLAEQSQSQAETLDARLQQAAQRDRELADAADDLVEHVDAGQRAGPQLPAPLNELFLPTRTNQSPLGIYGTFAANYTDFQDAVGNFPSPVFSPHFYMLLNEQFLLEVNPEFRAEDVRLESAQLDWFLHDNLTLVVGRFYSPLGFFNERLHTTWVYKTPDRPLMFQQVLPASLSFDGAQLRGAAYLGMLPVKLEYSGVMANGLSMATAAPAARDFADLFATAQTFDDANQHKALGGRLGLSFPTVGLVAGISGLANGPIDRGGQEDLSLWDIDLSWHQGNWDLKFEYANVDQQAPGGPIDRQGLYTQVAYRPYDSSSFFWQRMEGVFRFDYVDFDGIDLTATGLTFGGRERIPVDRNRYTVGVNYYPYPSMIIKFAYEILDETDAPELRDNGLLAQLTWGF